MFRLLGYVFSLLALAALGYDLWRGPLQEAPFAFTQTAEIWASLHQTSLIGLNSFIENTVSPELWDVVVLPTLTAPAFVLAAVLALIFFVFSRGGATGRSGLDRYSRHGRR